MGVNEPVRGGNSESSKNPWVTRLELETSGTIAERPRPTRCSALSFASAAWRGASQEAVSLLVLKVEIHGVWACRGSTRTGVSWL
jgi:hypothetical protein